MGFASGVFSLLFATIKLLGLFFSTKSVFIEANRIKQDALDAFASKAFQKYDAGQKEHGGLITERVSLEDLEDEIIDLWFYLQALKEKLAKAGDEGCCHAD